MADRLPDKMSVWVLTSGYPRVQDDTEGPWLRVSLRELKERGCDVAVAAPSYMGLKNHCIDGIPVYRYRYAPAKLESLSHEEGAPAKIADNPLLQLLAVPYVLSGSLKTLFLCLKLKPKIIHVHWPFPHGAMAFLAKLFYKAPIVLNFHGAELLLLRKKKWIKPFLTFFIKHANLILANSSFTAKKIKELVPRNVEISPYGTTLRNTHSAAQTLSSSGKFRVLFVGRHIERKGIDYLIKAAAALDPDKYEVRIAGQGDQTERLKALAAREAREQVAFLGKLSNENLKREYESAGCFILPAVVDSKGDTEGLGVVLIEAAEYGVPIIASGVGGIVDIIIDGKTGLLVKEKSPQELTEAILRLRGDAALSKRLADNCRAHVKENFSWERITAKLLALYCEAVRGKKR
jgi:glycosyltransferase involved in cell wall biosynthesis